MRRRRKTCEPAVLVITSFPYFMDGCSSLSRCLVPERLGAGPADQPIIHSVRAAGVRQIHLEEEVKFAAGVVVEWYWSGVAKRSSVLNVRTEPGRGKRGW